MSAASPSRRGSSVGIRISDYDHHAENDDASSASSSSSSSSGDSLISIDAEEEEAAEAVVAELNTAAAGERRQVRVGATVVRVLALLCACSLSIGSH